MPPEAKWECADRRGREDAAFAGGDELMPESRHMANIWQGRCPSENIEEDGWARTFPVRSFPSNGDALQGIIGNVWQGTAAFGSTRQRDNAPKASCMPQNTRGGPEDDSYAARHAEPVDSTTRHVGFRCVRREWPAP